MNRRHKIVHVAVILALAASSIFLARIHAEEKPSAVTIDNFSFTPATITVSAGTTVRWSNRDDIPHTVVSDDNGATFKSKALDTDDNFAFTFSKPGTYSYFCSLHPKMKGQVVVK